MPKAGHKHGHKHADHHGHGHKHGHKHDHHGDGHKHGHRPDRDQDIDPGLAKALRNAEEIYVAEFTPLNNSGVEAYAVLAVDYGSSKTSADDTLTVSIVAKNLDAGVHLAHMHGFENGKDATTPSIRADRDMARGGDNDGWVELLEGLPDYGQILLNLDLPDGSFPVTVQDGSFAFTQTYHLPSKTDKGHNEQSHAGDIVTTFDNLDLNHLVIHGLRVPVGAGAGTDGEVGDRTPMDRIDFDLDTYKEVLPAAVGEIEQVSLREARQFISNLANDGFMFA